MITKELIETRLKTLKEDQAKLLADAHAYEGAIQDCSYWLGQLKEESAESKS